jgi:hypothetical protein
MADEKKPTREERLAQALRDNLARRKARARAEGETIKTATDSEKSKP